MRWRSRLGDLTLVLFVTILGGATGAIALLALALRLSATGSAWAVTGLFLVGTVPAVALAPAIGLLLDRLETVRLLRLLALAAALLDLALAWAPGTLPVLALAAILAIGSSTSAPGMLAIAGSLGRRPGRHGVRPLTLVQVAQWTGTTLGALLGGGLVAMLGTRIPLLLDSGASLLAAAALAVVRVQRAPTRGSPGGGWADGILAGFRLLWREPLLRRLVGPVAIVIAFVNAVAVVEVYLATSTFRAGAVGYGALTAIWAGGIVLGALAVPSLGRFPPLLVTALGASLAALGLVGTAVSPDLELGLLPYLVAGFGNGLEMNSARVLVQMLAPPAVRGRAFAAYLAFGTAAAAVGTTLGGGLLALTTPREAVLLAAAPVAAAALWLGLVAGRDEWGRAEQVAADS